MAKIILGKSPKSFKRTLNFKLIDGSPGSMEVDYVYRDRVAFGKFLDGLHDEAKAEVSAEMDAIKAVVESGGQVPELSQSDIIAREDKAAVRYIMGCIEGWNLDVPFDAAAVAQLSAEVPAAIIAIMSTYREAITEGRQGN